MKNFLLLLMVAILVFIGCGTNPSGNEENKSSMSESLLDEVVAGHDVAMPKMLKLERLQKEARAAIDSLAKLPASTRSQNSGYASRLDSILKDLEYADFAMNKWMTEFNYDSLKDNEPERIKYLEQEKVKVNKMKDAVLNSISKADSLLKK